ncbi:RHS repeat domain-containing protein [Shewanella chilikensis]|uniref:RHS repeat domain-containing protein n=1 Tax=Shewanella chilikensis TaxID=558541 RepID=UPI00399A3A73
MRQGDNVFRYDANGRMVEKTLKRDGFRAQPRFYHWDEEDRLIRVSLPNGDIWHYEYDVFGAAVVNTGSNQQCSQHQRNHSLNKSAKAISVTSGWLSQPQSLPLNPG